MVADMTSGNEEVSKRALKKLASLQEEGRLSLKDNGGRNKIRVNNPGSSVSVIAVYSIGGMACALGVVWLLLFGLKFVGFADMTERVILLVVLLKAFANACSENLNDEFSRIGSRVEWIMIGSILVVEVLLTAYLILWVM